jgi:preprotein translocase subunit SecE
VSEDRAHETKDRLDQADAAPSSAAVRRERSSVGRSSPLRPDSLAGKGHPTRPRDATDTKVGLPARLMRFLREVVAELTKVIWPTRRELVVYTGVVLVFVSFMVAFVALLDMGLGKAVLSVFG